MVRKWPSIMVVTLLRWTSGIQISPEQLLYIMAFFEDKAPCRLLVFGLGNDSVFWMRVNRGGETLFLEDNEFWLKRIQQRTPGLEACLVEYNTKRRDWKMLLKSPDSLEMTLPEETNTEKWDVVVVDGPAGYDDNTSGRMKSIYNASKLVKAGGDVFVHDCNREVEDAYCREFLGPDNLTTEIRHRIGWLRHYGITVDC